MEEPEDAGALPGRWVEVYWAGEAQWYLGKIEAERDAKLKIAYTDGETHYQILQETPLRAGADVPCDSGDGEPWRPAEAAPPKKRAKTTTAAPGRRARTTDSAKPCGPPEDQRLCKLV